MNTELRRAGPTYPQLCLRAGADRRGARDVGQGGRRTDVTPQRGPSGLLHIVETIVAAEANSSAMTNTTRLAASNSNSRNGTTTNMALTGMGVVQIEVRRDATPTGTGSPGSSPTPPTA